MSEQACAVIYGIFSVCALSESERKQYMADFAVYTNDETYYLTKDEVGEFVDSLNKLYVLHAPCEVMCDD